MSEWRNQLERCGQEGNKGKKWFDENISATCLFLFFIFIHTVECTDHCCTTFHNQQKQRSNWDVDPRSHMRKMALCTFPCNRVTAAPRERNEHWAMRLAFALSYQLHSSRCREWATYNQSTWWSTMNNRCFLLPYQPMRTETRECDSPRTISSATSPRATSGTWLVSNISRKHLLKHAERPE